MSCKDCMEIPPVSVEYSEKGRYETIAGLKTYITGPEDAQKAVIDIYDVFGFASQTLQGADRLASHLGALVLVPDFLEGSYCEETWIPANTPEKQALFEKFRAGPANIQKNVEKLLVLRKEVAEKWPAVDAHTAVGGLCWGGKVAILACGEGNTGAGRRFAVCWTAHPGLLDIRDAEALTAPYICLASPGEPADVVADYKELFSRTGKKGKVETYSDMFHGWMGARANLSDEKNARQYERGYKQVADFLAENI